MAEQQHPSGNRKQAASTGGQSATRHLTRLKRSAGTNSSTTSTKEIHPKLTSSTPLASNLIGN